jgi:thioredoxin-like negative regulator of GroEL
MLKLVTVWGATIGIALALVCSSSEESAKQAREAVAESIARGDREGALEAVSEILDSAEDSAEKKLEVANLFIRAGSAPEASWLLEDAILRFPDESALYLQRTEVFLAEGKIEEVRAETRRFRDATFVRTPRLSTSKRA